MELAQRVTFDDYKRPAALALSETKYEEEPTTFEVTGWGSKREKGNANSKLMLTKMPYVNFEECKQTYAKLALPYVNVIEGMMCAGLVQSKLLNVNTKRL
jgi:hypothetical protein